MRRSSGGKKSASLRSSLTRTFEVSSDLDLPSKITTADTSATGSDAKIKIVRSFLVIMFLEFDADFYRAGFEPAPHFQAFGALLLGLLTYLMARKVELRQMVGEVMLKPVAPKLLPATQPLAKPLVIEPMYWLLSELMITASAPAARASAATPRWRPAIGMGLPPRLSSM